MKRGIWNGQIIAESNETIIIEGNHYFPPSSIRKAFFIENKTHAVCPLKRTVSYYDLVVEQETNKSATWLYPETSTLARIIKGYVPFWKGLSTS